MNTTASAELEQRLADEAIASTSGRSSSRSFDARRASLQQDAKRGSLQVDLPPVPGAARLLEPVPEERRVTIVVDSVNAWVPNFVAPSSITRSVAGAVSKLRTRKRPQEPADQEVDEEQPAVEDKQPHKAAIDKEATATAPKKQILFDINVSCQPGEVLALMGPSGGGKTSLLSIMGGRTPSSVDTQGRTLYNGRELTKEKKRKVGFVLQDDLLHEALTVHETLTYAALLRLPKTMTRAQKAGRVNAVIAALGLGNCRDTIIGGFFRRGVSGGERKRVSVGHELLINPSVMLLDEPTSGLDSTTAMHLLQTLRELAQGGRAVVTTIHQPSSRLYQQLDSLLLLSMGHAMFYGEASAASGWFERLGCVLPRGVNTADFILDCASGQVAAPKREVGEDSRLYLVHESERYLREHPNGFRTTPRGAPLAEADEAARDDAAAHLRSKGGRGGTLGQSISRKLMRANTWAKDLTIVKDRWGASYATQLQVLFTRSIKTRRFETLSIQDFVQFLTVGAVCGLIWFRRGADYTLQAAQDVLGLVFFEGLFLSFRIMFSALFTFPNEFKMLLKERSSGMYRLSAFYFARTASDLPMDWTIPTIFVIMLYWAALLNPTAGAFFANWSTVMLLQMVAQSFGLLIGAAVMVPKSAQTIAAVLMLTFMLTGGYYVRTVPGWIDWIKYASFMWYGNNLLLKIQFNGQTYYDCGDADPSDAANTPGCVALTDDELVTALNLQRAVDEWPWEAIALLGYLLLLRTAVYVVLRKKTGGV